MWRAGGQNGLTLKIYKIESFVFLKSSINSSH